MEVWCERVKWILRTQAANGDPLYVQDVATLWSSLYPDEAISCYQPVPSRLQKSMSKCPELMSYEASVV